MEGVNMQDRKRTIREIMNLVTRLRDQGAVSIEIDGVKATFLPKELEQSQPIVNTIQDVIHIQERAIEKTEKEEVKALEDEDPDLFMSANNE
jgi:hypothetical protein